MFNLLACGMQLSQNITNTLGSNGVFKIKDGSSDFLTLNQSNGTINLHDQLVANQRGSILKGGARFLHTYYPSGSSGANTFIGINSGSFTMSSTNPNHASYNTSVGHNTLSLLTNGYSNSAFGSYSLGANTTGYQNSAFGSFSMESNIAGFNNSAFGYQSLRDNTASNNSAFGYNSLALNTVGIHNSAFGSESLANNSGSNNSAFGSASLYLNSSGTNNSAFGFWSMLNNTIGNDNSAFGQMSLRFNSSGSDNASFGTYSLYSNTTGAKNSASGTEALYSNTTGQFNSAFGYQSLYFNSLGLYNSAFGNSSLLNVTTGDQNTAIGNFSGSNITTGNGNIAIGYNAQVPSSVSDNQIRIGNTFITYAGIQVPWTVTSDRRWKQNILSSNLGLRFISLLRPVSYTRKNDESGKTEYGLIAQEVEEALQQEGIDSSGMLTVTDEGMYELRYNDLLAPMIKAIQELKAENEKLRERIQQIESKQVKVTEK